MLNKMLGRYQLAFLNDFIQKTQDTFGKRAPKSRKTIPLFQKTYKSKKGVRETGYIHQAAAKLLYMCLSKGGRLEICSPEKSLD